ncbi:MAG: hypothetical protein Q4C61_08635 [Lachnospiraceae bacterium]|nr:hypothetical protein [Lachnospiraceae bacterium]
MSEAAEGKQKKTGQETKIKEETVRAATDKETTAKKKAARKVAAEETANKEITAKKTVPKNTAVRRTDARGSKQQDTYYQPKTDSSNSVLLHQIEKYNQHLKYQDYGRKYLLSPAEKVLKAPPRQILQTAISEKDEEAAEVTSLYDKTKAARILFASQADKAQIRKLYQDVFSMERYLHAGKIFVKDPFTEAGNIFQEIEGFSIIDPKKVTYGDLKMYQYLLKHQEASLEELLAVRKETNARYADGGRIDYQKLGRRNALKKKVDRLVSLSEINAFLEFSRNFDRENPEQFTPAQKNILHQESGFLEGHNPIEFAANETLIRQVLKSSAIAGEFSHLDPESLMNGRDIRRLLNGQIPGLRLEKAAEKPGKEAAGNLRKNVAEKLDKSAIEKPESTSGLNLNPIPKHICKNKGKDVQILLDAKTYHFFRGGLKSILWNQETYQKLMKKQQVLFGRESIKGWVFREFKQEMMGDEEFASMSGYLDHAVPLAITGIKAAEDTGKVAGKATAKSAAAIGNGVVFGLDSMGNEVAAEAVRSLGEGIYGTGKAVNEKITYIRQLPKQVIQDAERRAVYAAVSGARQLGKPVNALETALKSTKAWTVIQKSRVYQGMEATGKKAFYSFKKTLHITRKTRNAVFAFPGRMVDSIKAGIVKPALIFIGVIVFFQLAIAAIFGGLGGNSAVGVAVIDTPEHFNNPNYTSPEEMGFQQRYEQAQTKFQSQIDGIISGYAKTLNKKGQQIPYGVNGVNNTEGNENEDYVSGVSMKFDLDNSNNLEDILSCIAVVMRQKQAEHHAEALELLDCFYQSSHTYDYTESPLYSCDSGCEVTKYFCNEAEEEYPSTELKFAPYLYEELIIPDKDHECEVDRKNPEMKFSDYAGCVVTGTCFHNAGDNEDNFGRSKPQKSKCSNPEAYWSCKHSCTRSNCTHDCSRSTLGCGGYWYCGGHDHFGCPDGHEVKSCFGHVNIEMNIQMKTMEELFELGGVEVKKAEEKSEEELSGEVEDE